MISKKKAKSVFSDVLKTAISKGGLKYPFECTYNDKVYQVCQDPYRAVAIPKTLTDEEFQQLPTAYKKQDPYDTSMLSRIMPQAAEGKPIGDGKIILKDLRRGQRMARACEAYNRVIPVVPCVSVVNYGRTEKNKFVEDPIFIFNGAIAVPCRHIIHTLNLIEGGEIRARNPYDALFMTNGEAFAIIMPMNAHFWEVINNGEIPKDSDGDKA